MRLSHLKRPILLIALLIQGCATNDSNSPLVRFWNDGFVYSKKEGEINNVCSQEANNIYPKAGENDKEWYRIYKICMKKHGY